MAKYLLLGLFHEATPTADTLDQLRKLGVPDEEITVMSGIPYRAEMLGRRRRRGRVGQFSLLGAALGLGLGLFLSVGIFLLFPIEQGGQPIVPIPPTLIVLFEATMLGTMWAAFFGMLLANRFPIFKSQLYDPRITEGHIGVLVEVEDNLADQVEKILTDNGAHHLKRVDASPPANRFLFPSRAPQSAPREGPWVTTDRGHSLFWLAALAGLIGLTVVILLAAYGIIDISFPTQMANQDSIASLEGPRLAAPADAVPIQGPVLVDGQPASRPVPPDANSLQRGKVLFGIDCQLCHGADAKGDGPLRGFFNPHPVDLTGEAERKLSDDEIYLVITNGFGLMPRLAENLDPQERWDVIDYVRSLQK
jgi:mono/diheme cytochrome c family protein